MTLPAHLAAGLIIGKLTGNFSVALIGALVIDLDHVVSYLKHGILFKPRKLFKAISDQDDPWGDQRGFLHNIFAWVIISALVAAIDLKIGLVFSVAYFSHLLLDALDGAEFYPLFPIKRLNFRGPIQYYSKQEIAFTTFLLFIFLLLYL